MAGIRIKHGTVINRTLVIVDKSRPYLREFECPVCHHKHVFKTYHIEVDGEGAAIVSPEVWSYVQRIPSHGFQITNEVVKPPPKKLSVGFQSVVKLSDHQGREIHRVED